MVCYLVGWCSLQANTYSLALTLPGFRRILYRFQGTDAIKSRLTGDCNAYIASLLAKASELYGGGGNVAVAKDGLDLLNKISCQGGFVLKDFLKIDGYPVAGTVTGSIAGNNTFAAGSATVLISTRFMYGSNAATVSM